MADIYNQAIIHWRDSNGKLAVSFLPTQNQTPGGASAYTPLVTALQACCDAALVAVQYQATLVLGTAPIAGVYGTVWDRGVLFSRNAVSNAFTRNSLVGPKANIFEPDQITINLSDSRIIAVQTELQALIGDSVGNPVGPILRGERQKAGGS